MEFKTKKILDNIFDQKRSYAKKRKIEERNEMQMLLEAAESLKVRELEIEKELQENIQGWTFLELFFSQSMSKQGVHLDSNRCIIFDVYISDRKYQINPHISPWFSDICAAVIAHRNHSFCLHQSSKSSVSKFKLWQATSRHKMFLSNLLKNKVFHFP